MAWKPNVVKACVFDMFGTLFDVHSSVAACRDAFGPEGDAFSLAWRAKQLNYSWLRALMGRYVPFWNLTCDALDATLAAYGRADDSALRQRLLDAYRVIKAYPDAGPALEALREGGVRTAILTNGSRDMVESALDASGLGVFFDEVMSVEAVETFKPDPRVYRMAAEKLGEEASALVLVSAHPWDLAGARSFGFQGIHVDRAGSGNLERVGFGPSTTIRGLDDLPGLLVTSR